MMTFFFYDLETSGLSAQTDRIMQFAGQRMSMDLKPLSEPINMLVKLNNDTLPSPRAIRVTGITPQKTQEEDLTEAEFCKFLDQEVFTTGTIAVGYNSIRFDDEFIRHLFWRNFYDPYEWHWKNYRSRWDLLDVVRMVRALRPEGINWPIDAEGAATNKLELLTKKNNITHLTAHDALSDVEALIEVTRLIKNKQPRMFEYLLKMRDKKKVQELVRLTQPKPFVYTSGRYPGVFNKTTVVIPLMEGKNGSILVYDLRYNPEDLLSGKMVLRESEPEVTNLTLRQKLWPAVKEMHFNKCPAVAPIEVLKEDEDWRKIQLDKEVVWKNWEILKHNNELVEQIRNEGEVTKKWEYVDAESALYDGFLGEADRLQAEVVRNARITELKTLSPNFQDARLKELFIHYKARNFKEALTEEENKEWEKYRLKRIESQTAKFLNDLSELIKEGGYEFIAKELSLWYESLQP